MHPAVDMYISKAFIQGFCPSTKASSPHHHVLPQALRCESLIGPTVTYAHFLLLPLLFIYSFESKPLLLPSHSILFLPLALSFIPPSLPHSFWWCATVPMRRSRRRKKKWIWVTGGHASQVSATIKRKLICGLLAVLSPLALSKSRWMDGWMDGRTHSQQSWSKKELFIRLLDQASAEQSSRCTHAEVCVPAPPSHFSSPLSASKLSPNVLRYNWGLPPSINWQYSTLNCCHAAVHTASLYYYSWNVKKSTEKIKIKDALNFLDCANYKCAHFVHKIETHSEWYLLTVESSLSSCTYALSNTQNHADTHWTGSHWQGKSVIWSKRHISRFMNPTFERGISSLPGNTAAFLLLEVVQSEPSKYKFPANQTGWGYV